MRRPVSERITDSLTRELRDYCGGRDILMVQFALPYGSAVRAAAKALGLPYVVQLRGDDVWIWPHRDQASRDAFSETVRDASLVVGVSRALLEEARRLADDPLSASAVVPNGIDLDRFRPAQSTAERQRARVSAGIANEELVVLCVGDLLVRKGWLELLDALGGLSPGPRRVRLIGAAAAAVQDFDLFEEARRRAPNLAVRLERNLQSDRLAELYRAADVFCLPSHWEGLANALLEAMASGLPCVTTAVAGHPEVVTTGVDGLLVPPRDVGALRDALRDTLEAPALRDTLARAARARAERVGDSMQAGRRLSVLLEAASVNAFAADEAGLDPYALHRPLTSIT
jgi:glycosyltransferase involved in cell wall biosynthesis